VPQRESDLAENLIDKMLSVEFEPEKYHDEYRERVLAMIDQRAKGQEITFAPSAPERRGKSRCYLRSVKAEPRASSAATRDRYTRTGGQVGAEKAEGLRGGFISFHPAISPASLFCGSKLAFIGMVSIL
jgi:non-homologous end joining protein Ku